MPAAWPSLAGECVLVCKVDGHGSSDASSGFMLRFRVKMVSRGGCPGKVWGLLHNISQMFSLGQCFKLAPRAPSNPNLSVRFGA